MIVKFNRKSGSVKKLFLIMICIAVCIIAAAYSYYSSLYKNEDPRVFRSKELFNEYNRLMSEQKFSEALSVLDEIEKIYSKLPEYRDSYEIGLIYNNRSSVYLMKALYAENISSDEKELLLENAENNVLKSILIYENWKKEYAELDQKQICNDLESKFFNDTEMSKNSNAKDIIRKRVEDILLCQKEIDRRSSVSYTNLGTIQRHCSKQEAAAESFIKALKLWPDNHTAQSNLNVLMGKPPKERSVIQKLFPPSKDQ